VKNIWKKKIFTVVSVYDCIRKPFCHQRLAREARKREREREMR
jgi:hypothetical protein